MIYNKACQETKNQTNKKNPKKQKREIIKKSDTQTPISDYEHCEISSKSIKFEC